MPRLPFALVAVAAALPVAGVRSTPLPQEGRNRYTSPATGMTFIHVPPGTFLMGSPADEKGRSEIERQHEVTLSKGFFLGVHEVTRGQFAKFVADTGYKTGAEADGKGGFGWDAAAKGFRFGPTFTWRAPGFDQTDDHPVVLVSWNDAVAFAAWLSKADRRAYRLPTGAEWEYACRAGTRTRYSFGDDDDDMARFGNVADASLRRADGGKRGIPADDGYAFTAPVGRFRANAFGFHDMHGNVCEWCADGSSSYPAGPVTDPTGPTGPPGPWRVIRGGSFNTDARECRSAYRFAHETAVRTSILGFRLAFTPPP